MKAAVLWIEKLYCLQARHNSICIAASLPSVPQKRSAQDQCKIFSELVSDSSTSYEKTRTCTTHSKGHYSKQEIPVHLLWGSKAEVPSSQSVQCQLHSPPVSSAPPGTAHATSHWTALGQAVTSNRFLPNTSSNYSQPFRTREPSLNLKQRNKQNQPQTPPKYPKTITKYTLYN